MRSSRALRRSAGGEQHGTLSVVIIDPGKAAPTLELAG